MPDSITITLPQSPSHSYPIFFGKELWNDIGAFVKKSLPTPGRLAIISDQSVDKLYGANLEAGLAQVGKPIHRLTFAPGEGSKSRATKALLEDALFELGCGRDTVILALGGGVTTDLAGFVAATYMRGIPYLQIPTTLLAAGDAAIGGKTGINTDYGKNVLGAFYQPDAVFVDLGMWQKLPLLERQNGLAETIKQAMIADLPFFEQLESARESLQAYTREKAVALPDTLAYAIATMNVKIKSRIVQSDERENGRREILNFGHTIGHAIEALSHYTLSHGHAIAIGMCIEAGAAIQLRRLDQTGYDRLVSLISAVGLPTKLPSDMKPAAIIERTLLDKKTRGGQARYVLPSAIGEVKPHGGAWSMPLPDARIISVLQSAYSS